jgi:5-formyltetrahydrofolate cyclo-ligase
MEFCPVLLAELKSEARRVALARRAGMDPAIGAALVDLVLGAMPPPDGAVVAGFWPMGPEIDIRPLLHALHDRGHPIALPVTPKRGLPLAFHRWQPGQALARGPMGTSQPGPEAEPLTPAFLLVPLLAFDRGRAPARLWRRLLRPHARRAARRHRARLRLCVPGA